MTKDVIIGGGGVIGCAIALKLAGAGLKVGIIERGRIGCEASRAAAGMLAPQTEAASPGHFLDLCLRGRDMHRGFAEMLAEISGIDIEYRDAGTLAIALGGEDEMLGWSSWQADAGLRFEKLSPAAIRSLEPAVTELAARAIFIPEDHQVENRRMMDALDIACRQAGVEIVEGEEVISLTVEHGKAKGVVCEKDRFDAGAVVVAAGCWSSRLLEPVGLNITITPARGQMIALAGAQVSISRTLHSSKCYIVPRGDRRLLVGATVEYVGFHKANTVGGISSLLAAALEVVPALKESEIIETWSGLRPDTQDHLPILGPSGIDNLLLATGHFRNGILLAPITAELIAECVINNRAQDWLSPFSFERFEKRAAVTPLQGAGI